MRRTARKIWVVRMYQNESAEHEDWEGEARFTTERAAGVFARAAQGWDAIDVVTGPDPAPLYHSGKAAIEDFR